MTKPGEGESMTIAEAEAYARGYAAARKDAAAAALEMINHIEAVKGVLFNARLYAVGRCYVLMDRIEALPTPPAPPAFCCRCDGALGLGERGA